MSTPMDYTTFVAKTVDWINRALVPTDVTVDADTALFADGLIDSIRILKLIAWTERALGIRIPDSQIRMDHFRSVRQIADTFARRADNSGGADVAA